MRVFFVLVKKGKNAEYAFLSANRADVPIFR